MTNTRLFALIGLAALASGAGLWVAQRQAAPTSAPAVPVATAPAILPAAVLATEFVDAAGQRASLGQFQGHVAVVNFWATWCGPCRAEMPAFDRLHRRWAPRGVRFVGISAEPAELAARFGRELGVTYPLWTGADQVQELSRRLGNSASVLPHTVVLGPTGEVLEQRVGPYTESELEIVLSRYAPKSS